MKIIDYLKQTNEKPYQFAKRAGIGYGLIYDLVADRVTNLQAVTIKKIMEASEGAVQPEDLI